MSTNTVTNNGGVSSAPQPAAKAATKAVAKGGKVNRYTGPRHSIVEGNTPAWNWGNYLQAGKAGDWATQDGMAYRWNGVYWAYVADNEGKRLSTKFLADYMPDKASNNMAVDCWKYGLNMIDELPTRSKKLVIATQNAYLHIDGAGNAFVEAPDKALGLTFAVNATVGTPKGNHHNPQRVPDTSKFGRFLATSLPDPEIRDFVQEQCALTLIPGPHQLCWWWMGTGSNGKGTMVNILRGFHARTGQIWLGELGDKTALAACLNASLIVTPEVANGRAGLNEEAFKAFHGGDQLNAKLLYKDLVPFVNTACHVVCSNAAPMVTDGSDGMWRRLCIVEWTQRSGTFKKIDNLDKLILAEESHLVLDWLLEGVKRIVARGGFLPEAKWPASARMLKKAVRVKNDCIGAWQEAIGAVADTTTLTPKETVYKSYVDFCEADSRHVLTAPQFWGKIWANPEFVAVRPTSARGDTVRVAGKQRNAVRILLPTPVEYETPMGEILIASKQEPIKSAPIEPVSVTAEPAYDANGDWSF